MDKESVKSLIYSLANSFVGREEEAKVAVFSLITKNHCVLLGQPGVGKSAILNMLADSVGGKFYYYLMNRYTIPDELVGAIDPIEYSNGRFVRMMKNKLPEAHIAFIDEVFKGSSETLNTLLNIMNERNFVDTDGKRIPVPLISMFAASNEMPHSDELQAFYDRILLKHFVKPVNNNRLEEGLLKNLERLGTVRPVTPVKFTLDELDGFYNDLKVFMVDNAKMIAKTISELAGVLKAQGVNISDRTIMNPTYLPILVAARSYVYDTPLRRSAIEMSKYVLQNNEEQLDAYNKALETIYPPELREAQRKIEETRSNITALEMKAAKENAMIAIEQCTALNNNPDTKTLYSDEIKEIVSEAEILIKKISEVSQQIIGQKR